MGRRGGGRAFGLLLRVYPSWFRSRYSEELWDFFEEDRQRAGSVVVFWVRTVVDVLRAGWRVRRGRRDAGPASRQTVRGAWSPDPGGRDGRGMGERLAGWFGELAVGARSLSRQPTYVVASVVTLGVGIGASVAIFSVVDAVLLRPLPYPSAESLVAVGTVRPDGRVGGLSAPNARDMAAAVGAFESVSLSRVGTLDLTGTGEPERLIGAAVTASWFEQLGVSAARGRLFEASDDQPGVARVGVISHGLWQRRWAGDESVVGRTVTMNDSPMTIVGVLRAGFSGPEGLGQGSVEVWFPVSFVERGEDPLSNRADQFLTVMARLVPGATLESASAEVSGIAEILAREYPAENGKGGPFELSVVSLRESTLGDVRSRLALFGGAVALLFLAALSNAASLMLGRVAQRSRELAVRGALGAGRARIVGQVLAESVILAALACVLGVGLCLGGLELLDRVRAGALPRVDGIGVNARVLAFAVMCSLGMSVLVGLVPGLRAAKLRATAVLRSGSRHTTGPAAGLRRALVVVETGVALVLLAGAGLLMNSFIRLSNVPLGFEPDGVTTMEVFVGGWYSTSQERIAIYRDLMEQLGGTGGIESASVTTDLPLSQGKLAAAFAVDGPDPDAPPADAGFHYVAPRYFATLGIPMLPGGRDFTDRDVDGGAPVAIINRSLALALFGTEDAVGRRLRFGSLNGPQPPLEVVGVVGDLRHQGLDIGRGMEIFVPHNGGFIGPPLHVLVRSSLPAESLVPQLRAAARHAGSDLPVGRIAPLSDRVRSAAATPRFHAFLTLVFALSAMAIAVTGIYGIMAHSVAQQTRELGVRMALGARGAEIVGLVLRRGMSLSAMGIGAGLIGAALGGRVLAGLLFGVKPGDIPTLGAVAILMAGVQLAACMVPARRAASLQVATTLRADGD